MSKQSFGNNLKKSLDMMQEKINEVKYNPLPNLASMDEFLLVPEEFDTAAELIELEEKTLIGLQDLAAVYIDKEILELPYVKYRIEKDAKDLAHLEQLCRDSQRSLTDITRKITQEGDGKLYLAKAAIQKEMRENIKFSSTFLMTVESFYKKLQDEIVINKILPVETPEIKNLESEEIPSEIPSEIPTKITTDRKQLNEFMNSWKNKK